MHGSLYGLTLTLTPVLSDLGASPPSCLPFFPLLSHHILASLPVCEESGLRVTGSDSNHKGGSCCSPELLKAILLFVSGHREGVKPQQSFVCLDAGCLFSVLLKV